MALTDALVVCTRHRPDDVAGVLATIAAQTALPADVVIVDSSDDDATLRVVEQAAAAWPAGSTLRHLRTTPSLTHQRVVGIAATQGDIVHFVDDDVRLDPGYVAAIRDEFTRDERASIGVVGGFLTGQTRAAPKRLDVWFGLDSQREGVMLRTGRNIPVVREPRASVDVDWCSGAAMSFRRSILELEPPDEVSFPFEGEDADLTFRARRHARVVVTPKARAVHLEAQTNRVVGAAQAEAELAARLRRVANDPQRLSMRRAMTAAVYQWVKFAVVGIVRRSPRHRALAQGTMAAIRKRRYE